jgi:hypothetical protein
MENLRAESKSNDKKTLDDIIPEVIMQILPADRGHQQTYRFQNSGGRHRCVNYPLLHALDCHRHARHHRLHTRNRQISSENLFAIIANIARKSLGKT